MRAVVLASLVVPSLVAAAPVQVAPGVHVIVHPDATDNWPNGNTTFVIGERGVLVVDANYLPSVARTDLAELRKLTRKPVRWLVNTHWHYDHNFGNSAYRKAFPDVEIVAHVEAKRLMDHNVPRFARVVTSPTGNPQKELAEMRAELAAGKGDARRLRDDIARRENEQRELAAFEYAPPTLTFGDELRLDLGGGREVRILHLGRGNTPGDSVIYLPADKLAITGDLVVAPVPYAFFSYPMEWIATLRRLIDLGATTYVPGHGPVMRDDGYIRDVIALLESATRQVNELAAQNLSADEVRGKIDLAAAKQKFCAGDPEREETWAASIHTALIDRTWLWARGGL